MFYREILQQLEQWKQSPNRKPLILRGARQVGKTTVVNEFGKTYDNYLSFNLENIAKRRLFERDIPLDMLVEGLFNDAGKAPNNGSTLIFIDEIQNSLHAIALLRYFYEQRNDLHVIAAGSLLENVVDINVSFPVGRVQYMAVHPCTFREFINALNKQHLVKAINSPEHSAVYHEELMALFNCYSVVGGMPEAVKRYVQSGSVLGMDDVYETLLQTYIDDVEKYVNGNKLKDVVRHIVTYGWAHAGETITLGNFAGSRYGAREVGEAFNVLTKAMLVELIYPSTSTSMPALPEMKRHPKLAWLDTGLVNYSAGVRDAVISSLNLLDVWRGRIAEHLVAQELLALSNKVLARRSFWTSGKGGSTAEVDFTLSHKSNLFPIEVKAGSNSHLRSLHSFIDKAPIDVAIRVWNQPFSTNDVVTTIGRKPFKLVNIPFYLVGNLPHILDNL